MRPPRDVIDEYVARKRAKGVYGEMKKRRWQGRPVLTGFCPCRECGHNGEPMIICDAGWEDCHCCAETCS